MSIRNLDTVSEDDKMERRAMLRAVAVPHYIYSAESQIQYIDSFQPVSKYLTKPDSMLCRVFGQILTILT